MLSFFRFFRPCFRLVDVIALAIFGIIFYFLFLPLFDK